MTEAATADLADRFHEKYVPEPNSGCWIWVGAERKGYGRLYYRKGGRQLPYAAHRLSYELHKGTIPSGMHVCHRCDNPSCVNPDHLFCGTDKDNVQDMIAKGRAPHQQYCHLASEIKNSPKGLTALAREYGLNKTTIWNIKTGRTWAHL